VPGLAATQRRHLGLSGDLLGLGGERRQAERIRDVLDLRGLEHQQAREQWHAVSTRRERGPIVVGVLRSLDPSRADRLLAAGFLAGLWGRPWRIDPETGRRRPVPGRGPPTTFVVPCASGSS
jgi:hypothetical protein